MQCRLYYMHNVVCINIGHILYDIYEIQPTQYNLKHVHAVMCPSTPVTDINNSAFLTRQTPTHVLRNTQHKL